ncbi:MAG: c-type cytochrome [Planctomycetales bacterium]|nr:c-type cytochrome [Planctomycetales bacterium]
MATDVPIFRLNRAWVQEIRVSLVGRTILLCTLVNVFPSLLWSQDSPDFFRQNCMNCHTIGGGRLTGPDLKDVSERKDREWLIGFMMNPKSYLDSGDPYAIKILEESRNVPMPTLPGMTRERSENLLDLIDAESKLTESQFKGLQISNKPFNDADRKLGRDIFLGKHRLEAGGAACISCHSMHDVTTLGGGRLGPDLTNIYERLKGRKALSAWLVAPGTETMQPIFKNHPISNDEIHALVAYFEASAGESPAQPTSSRIALLFLGLMGSTAAVFGFDAIWKRRFYSVRQPLVDANSHQSSRSTKAHS